MALVNKKDTSYVIDGVEILFNEDEMASIAKTQNLVNESGFADIDITLLTALETRIAQQKFYTAEVDDFIDIARDTGGYADAITAFKTLRLDAADDSWEADILSDNARKPQVAVGLEPFTVRIRSLVKMVSYSLLEIRQAQQTGVWNVVLEKERARKQSHDLYLQRVLLKGTDRHEGLLNLSGVTADTTTIAKQMKNMSVAEWQALLGKLFSVYANHTNFTAMPNRFVVPYTDYLGLAQCADETYPLKTKLQRLEESFKQMCGPDAKILPLSYCNADQNGGTNKYVMYRKDFDTVRAYMPIGYSVVEGASVDGFNYQNTAYSRVSDVVLVRPKEVMYFTNTDVD